jgi:hypothetical protein
VKSADPNEPADETIDVELAWIVFQRRLRRSLLERSRREMRRPGRQSVRVAVDQTILAPSSSHEDRP